MRKIILDRSGDLRESVFYRFAVPFDDGTDGLPRSKQWIVAPRSPKEGETLDGRVNWIWFSGLGQSQDRVVTKSCPRNKDHVTHWFYTRFATEAFGGKEVSPFIATSIGDAFALSGELKQRIAALKLRGGRLDPVDVTVHVSGKRLLEFWALQFVGKALLRIPAVVDCKNQCPFCGRGEVFCTGCGLWAGSCSHCEAGGMAVREDKHEGLSDKRIPFEDHLWSIIEAKTWDGSDLVQSHGDYFASKRFIDWLLRIHAAPFYAEPVYFCVDGMNDQQKKWLDDLQKPFEA